MNDFHSSGSEHAGRSRAGRGRRRVLLGFSATRLATSMSRIDARPHRSALEQAVTRARCDELRTSACLPSRRASTIRITRPIDAVSNRSSRALKTRPPGRAASGRAGSRWSPRASSGCRWVIGHRQGHRDAALHDDHSRTTRPLMAATSRCACSSVNVRISASGLRRRTRRLSRVPRAMPPPASPGR